MGELPTTELVVYALVVGFCAAGAVVGVLQLGARGERYRGLLPHVLALAVVLEVVLLVMRGIAIGMAPLTGLFESMLVLSLVLGLIYLVLGVVIRQVWFGSVMAWLVLILVLLTGLVAAPASRPVAIAARPWAIVHGLAMVLGAAMILLAAVTAWVYLLGCRRLKQRQVTKVLGVVPNIQKLERINLFSLKCAFVLVTIGFAGGVGGAWMGREVLGADFLRWLFDSKILAVGITWLLLAAVLIAHGVGWVRGKRTAQVTLVAFFWILFALVGTAVLCDTKHDFSGGDSSVQVISRDVDE